jgi:hypothetical protein
MHIGPGINPGKVILGFEANAQKKGITAMVNLLSFFRHLNTLLSVG